MAELADDDDDDLPVAQVVATQYSEILTEKHARVEAKRDDTQTENDDDDGKFHRWCPLPLGVTNAIPRIMKESEEEADEPTASRTGQSWSKVNGNDDGKCRCG